MRIVRVEEQNRQSRGARLVANLRGRGDGTLSTDEIMALTRTSSSAHTRPSRDFTS